MSENLTCFRVFIASPGGLDDERKAFRDEIEEYNKADAIERGFYFHPIGWEETLGGVGRPQKFINEDIEKSDFLVLLLWDRWGSQPDNSSSQFTSGTEEEYHLALKCYDSDDFPMKNIILMFKSVAPHQMADPGPQLQNVLDFRRLHEEKKTHYFHIFDSIDNFRKQLRKYLASWIRLDERVNHEDFVNPLLQIHSYNLNQQQDLVGFDEPASPIVTHDTALKKAWDLADIGRHTEAEIEFAKALVSEHKPKAFYAYGRFLCRVGRIDQAIAIFKEMISVAENKKDILTLCHSYTNLGNVFLVRCEYASAEQMYRKALEINYKLGRKDTMAILYSNIGNMLLERNELDGALEMYQKSLEIHEKQDNKEGIAIVCGNLGNMARKLGNNASAKRIYQYSLELYEGLDNIEGMANNYSNLGITLLNLCDLDGSEQMHRKALDIYHRLGHLAGKAIVYGNLGVLLRSRGELNEAEQMSRKSIELNEKLGNLEGMARDYSNLGLLHQDRGDLDEAEQMFLKSLDISEKRCHLKGISSQYKNLSNILRIRGDLVNSEKMYRKSLELTSPLDIILLSKKSEEILRNMSRNSDGTVRSL